MTYVAKDSDMALTQTDVLRHLVKVIEGGKSFVSLDELDAEITAPRNRIATRVGGLMGQGLARSHGVGQYIPTAKGKQLIADGGEVKSGPRKGVRHKPRATDTNSQRARLWRAIITLKRFTVSEIVVRAAQPQDKNPMDSARRYVNHLNRAEYLVELPRRQKDGKSTSNGEKVFWLKESFGRLPPRVRKAKDGTPGMFDPNNEAYRPFTVTEGKAA